MPPYDMIHAGSGNSKLFRNLLTVSYRRIVHRPNFADCIIRKFGHVMRFSDQTPASALRNHVLHVSIVGIWEKVRRIDAKKFVLRSVVTMMADLFAFRNGAEVENVTGPACTDGSESSNFRIEISDDIRRCIPNPTWPQLGTVGWNRSVFVHLGPKPLRKVFGKSLFCEVLRSYRDHVVRFVRFALQGRPDFFNLTKVPSEYQSPFALSRCLGFGTGLAPGWVGPGPAF